MHIGSRPRTLPNQTELTHPSLENVRWLATHGSKYEHSLFTGPTFTGRQSCPTWPKNSQAQNSFRAGLIALVMALLFVLNTGSIAATAGGPTEKVKSTIDAILEILRDNTLDWESRQVEIEAIIDKQFDFQSMSQSVLATNWRKATPLERERFVQFFSQYLEDTYMRKLKNYSNEHVRYGKEKITGEFGVVDTFIVTDTAEIPVTFKMKQTDGEWFTYDVVIEGVSLVNNYRQVYAAIVNSHGMDGLLQDLEAKISDYKVEQGDSLN